MTSKAVEQVAQEKKRASLSMGDSKAKADRYAQEVRDYATKEKR